jgi:hypothetical protein
MLLIWAGLLGLMIDPRRWRSLMSERAASVQEKAAVDRPISEVA